MSESYDIEIYYEEFLISTYDRKNRTIVDKTGPRTVAAISLCPCFISPNKPSDLTGCYQLD